MPDMTPSALAPVSVPAALRRGRMALAPRIALPAACCTMLLCLLLAGCAVPRIGIYQDPLSGPEHLELGRAYEQKGELDLARREYVEAVRDGLPLAHLHLANLLFQKGELGEAESHYRSSIRALPEAESAPARNNLAWLLLTRAEKPGEAQPLAEAQRLAEDAVRLADDEHRASYEDTLQKVKAARNR